MLLACHASALHVSHPSLRWWCVVGECNPTKAWEYWCLRWQEAGSRQEPVPCLQAASQCRRRWECCRLQWGAQLPATGCGSLLLTGFGAEFGVLGHPRHLAVGAGTLQRKEKEGREMKQLLGCSCSASSAKELFPPTFLKVTFIGGKKKKKGRFTGM